MEMHVMRAVGELHDSNVIGSREASNSRIKEQAVPRRYAPRDDTVFTLLVAERLHWIDAPNAKRRHRARHDRDANEHRSNAADDNWILRTRVEQQRRDDPARGQCDRRTNENPQRAESDRPAHHERDQILDPRAEREPHADFVIALLDEVRDDTERSYRCDDEREDGERREHDCSDSPCSRLRFDAILQHRRIDIAERRIDAQQHVA